MGSKITAKLIGLETQETAIGKSQKACECQYYYYSI